MFKKLISLLLSGLLIASTPLYAAAKSTAVIDEFKGLDRSANSDKTAPGSHTRFDNVYVKDGNIQSVKGRNRLNSSALSNTTNNGFWYYENAAGTTKKLLRFENTVFASYDVDGTNRTSLNTGLTNEMHDAVQIGDTLYFTSDTDGLYKWTGSGAATAISGVAAPSSVDFSAASAAGGMTSGLDAIVIPKLSTSANYWKGSTSTGTCIQDFAYLPPFVDGDSCDQVLCTDTATDPGSAGSGNCFDSTNFTKSCATTTTYGYKITKYSSVWGIESEPSTADTATLTGANTVTMTATNAFVQWTDAACSTGNRHTATTEVVTEYTGAQTSTTGTLASAPSAPFDGYCVYQTVAGGSDYFKSGCVTGGGSTYTNGKPDVSLGDPLDSTIDTINPPSYRYIEEFKGAIFLAQENTVYFNRLPVSSVTSADTYWLESDKFTTGSKKPLTGLHKTSDSLLMFTADRILELTGFGYSSFKLKPFVEGVGAVNDETIESDNDGNVIFFAGTQGVFKIRTYSQLQDDSSGAAISNQARVRLTRISSPSLDEMFKGTDSQIVLTVSDYATSHAYYDKDNDLYFLYIGEHCFILDNAKGIWSHVPAVKMGASLYRKSPSGAGQGVLIDTVGFFFNNWLGYENGIESGSVTGTITASGNTTLTCGACTFNTTNDGLKGLWVALLGDDQEIEYRQIASNTSTQITVSTAWTVNPITSDIFYVAYIIPDFATKIYSLEKPPKRSLINKFYITNELAASTQLLYYYSFEDKSTDANNAKSYDLSTNRIYENNFPMNAHWLQMRFRAYLYSTSESIASPLNLISYAFRGEVEEEK